MADTFELTDEMRAQIGTVSPPWTLEVTTTSVRAFARGVGYGDPVYFDVDAARKAGYRTLPAPPTYLGTPVFIPGRSDDTFSQPKVARQGVNHGLKGLLDGGTETEYFADICAGDTLTIVSRIAALDVRNSPTLGKMLIMTSESTYTNQDGKKVAVQRGQAIFY
jgi:N-terminal half of MaoC dehydratase